VVAGWIFEYMIQSITGNLYAPVDGLSTAQSFTERMKEYISGNWAPLINTYIVIAINLAILLCGVQKGIERISNILMPLLFALLVIFCCVSLSLPGAMGGVEFFFKPDFSKITPSVVINALGQAFFSLSLGMGILITYSAYYPDSTKLPKTAITVSALDLLVAVMMGLIIFPAVVSFGLENESLQGQTLVFVTLPEVFAHMSLTGLWSTLFFLTLSVAAITSTISIAEVSVSFCQDRFKMSRVKACLTVILPTFLFSSLSSLSLGSWECLSIGGKSLFEILDIVATNVLLPIGSFLLCIYAGWILPRKLMIDQLTNNGTLQGNFAKVVLVCVRYIAPPAILIILISTFL
ncbi:MAG: sodium-dependent transporter, partial [Muribaculaceae bacterium]|nr:sodium-dependent transporter [Muribaculaceae bacterium]